jgi:hypothetical protein
MDNAVSKRHKAAFQVLTVVKISHEMYRNEEVDGPEHKVLEVLYSLKVVICNT